MTTQNPDPKNNDTNDMLEHAQKRGVKMERNVRKIKYEYKGSSKTLNLIECAHQIATICEVIESDDGQQLDIQVVSEGMNYEQLVEMFPPDANGRRAGLEFCLLDIMTAVIWEAYRDEGTTLEEGNVRHFWYTHMKFLWPERLTRHGRSSWTRAW